MFYCLTATHDLPEDTTMVSALYPLGVKGNFLENR